MESGGQVTAIAGVQVRRVRCEINLGRSPGMTLRTQSQHNKAGHGRCYERLFRTIITKLVRKVWGTEKGQGLKSLRTGILSVHATMCQVNG